MKKKFLALVLTLAMVLSLAPATALAGNTSLLSIKPDEGSFATYEFYKIKDDASSLWYTQIVKTGDMLNQPADPTRTGFYFTGWKTADGAEVPFGRVTVEKTGTIQCYAQWEKNANPIHVYFMAAEKAAENSNEVVYTGVAQNGTVTIPADYQDITWKTADGKAFDGTGVTGDMNVYPASASCWLTFDSQGGSAIASHYVQQGESFELSKVGNPTKAGYRFAGWSSEVNGTKQTEVIPNGDTKLYALWTPATAKYTVIHWQENANDDGYSYIASEEKFGTTDGLTNAAAKSYQGFTEQAIDPKNINGDGSTIVNVFYKRNVYEVKFKLDKPTYTCGKEEHKHTHGIMGIGSCYDKNNNLKCGKEAHTHDKSCGKTSEIVISAKYGAYIGNQWPTIRGSSTWKTSQYGSTNQVNIETMPLNGATFYGPKTGEGSESARYYVEVLPGETGTVTQGGVTYKLHHTDTTPGTRYEVTDEDKYELTGFTYEGGTSNGDWYNNAQFYYTRNSYDVVYISNGAEKKESYKYEQDISGAGSYEPDNAPAGYKFGGWCSDPSGTTPYDFSGKTMPAQNITVYAKWVPITLTLTIQGVDGVNSGEVSYKQVINRADVYTDATAKLATENKTVLYWVNCETNGKVDVSSQMTKNLTIRPVLKGDTYAVTYDSGATDSQKYWYNTIAKVKNYTGDDAGKFLYWTDADENQYHPGDVIQMTANVTLKPNFSVENPGQTYSVTYHSNFEPDATYKHEGIKNNAQFTIKTYAETELPSQNGYEFTGWNTKRDGTGKKFKVNSTARMDGPDNNHLYAQWSPSTYTLTYDANGGQFGSGDSALTTKQESDIRAGDHSLKYSPEYTPTHAESEGKNVIFLGWSETDDSEKIYDKGDTIPNLIQSVTINGNKTVYAVWGYDAIGGEGNTPDGVPDVFNAVVTYNIVGGTWDGTHASATEVIKVKELKNGVWENTGNNKLKNIPDTTQVMPDKNHTLPGSWGKDLDSTPTTNTVVTADKIYTYTLSEVTTGTLTITKKVVGDGLTVDSLPKNFQITVKDAQGETKGTLTKTDKAKKADDTLTWTIRDLTPGTYTVSESNADVKDYTYTTTYNNVAATQANPATVTVAVNDTSAMTVTNTYTKNATVKLSDLIKKELTVKDGSTLPAGTTFSVKVTPTPTTTGDQGTQTAITGTTTSEWKDGTTDKTTGDTTYTASFNFTKGLSLPAGTYTYTVQETEGDVSGMQYDSKEYTLTIEVENSDTVKYTTKEGTTSTEVSTTKPLTIKNTYQTPNLSVTKQPYKVNGADFDANKTVAHVGDKIIWSVTVKNNGGTTASTTLTETLTGAAVYDNEACTGTQLDTNGTWTATVSAGETKYYVTYTVQAKDIPNGKIVNTIVKGDDKDHPINSDPVSTWDTKQLKSATSNLNTSDWTTTVTLELPTVKQAETTVTTDNIIVNRTEVQPIIAISNGSYVIDQIGNEFTFMDGLSLKVNGTELPATQDTTNKNLYRFGTETGGVYPYTVTYTAKNDETKEPAQFTWNINENVYAGTTVTLSYKLKLTTPKTAAGTYGVEDLNGNGQIEQAKALYTNESAILYKKEENTKLAEFPKPSVSYTIKGSSGGHSGGTVTIPDDVPTGLNGKDHYAYVVGYPDGMVYPQKNITRAEVATIFFRLLTDETREANMTKSNSYNDMKDGAWYTCAVSTLSKMGIIKGYEDGSFKPDASISRAEFAAIAARFDPDGDKTPATFSDVSSHWAKDEISIAANHGWIKGYEDGSFKPDQKITRAETMTLVNRVLKRLPETKDDLHKDMKTWPDNQNESAWFYLAVQEATNSHYQKLKKDGIHETWESMRETRDWAALEK